MREEILSAFIRLVSHTPELQAYTASRLYSALKEDISQESLTLAAVWILGEFGDSLLEGGLVDEESPRPVCCLAPLSSLVADVAQLQQGHRC